MTFSLEDKYNLAQIKDIFRNNGRLATLVYTMRSYGNNYGRVDENYHALHSSRSTTSRITCTIERVASIIRCDNIAADNIVTRGTLNEVPDMAGYRCESRMSIDGERELALESLSRIRAKCSTRSRACVTR